MRIPFYRTTKQAYRQGFVKTTSIMLAILLKTVTERLKYFPDSIIVEVNKSKMMLFPKRGAIHTQLFLHRKREPVCTEYLMHSNLVKDGDVVLDIGANIGYYSLVESQLVGKHGKVYAVEPVLDNFKLLEKNVKLNEFENIETFRLAFGERDARSKIYVSNRANLCAIKRSAVGGKIIGEEEVPMLTVDTFSKDKGFPNLIRMDVEGYEYEIIKGMPQTLKRDVAILLELHPRFLHEKLDEILQILAQNNFKVKLVVFEDKVEENKIVRFLMKKGGNALPIVGSNVSMKELKSLIDENPEVAPNVVFQKQNFNAIN